MQIQCDDQIFLFFLGFYSGVKLELEEEDDEDDWEEEDDDDELSDSSAYTASWFLLITSTSFSWAFTVSSTYGWAGREEIALGASSTRGCSSSLLGISSMKARL